MAWANPFFRSYQPSLIRFIANKEFPNQNRFSAIFGVSYYDLNGLIVELDAHLLHVASYTVRLGKADFCILWLKHTLYIF